MIDKEAIEKMTAIREYRIKKGIDNREDQEVIDMVNRNHRLNVEVTRTVGYIVPVEEARRIAAQRAAADQQQSSIVGVVAVFLITALAVVLGIVGLVG